MAGPLDLADAPADLLDAVLAGALGADAVRTLVSPPLDGDALELLSTVVGSAAAELALVRTKFKPGRSLTAYYVAPAADGDGDGQHVAVTWSRAAGAAKSTPSAVSNDGRTVVVAAPADSRLPGLARLADRAHLAAALGRLEPALACRGGDISLMTVRYRPAQRHVLRADVAGPRPRRLFVKIDRDDSGARAVPLATALELALVPCRDRVGVVAPAGYLVGERAAVWWAVRGPTLSQALVNAPAPAALLRRVAAGLRALHDAASSITEPLVPGHDAAAELAATVRAGEIVAGLAPPLGERYRALAADVLAQLPAVPPAAMTTIHGDAKGDNVVLDGDRVVFLDLDRMARADRALDLAKLLADLRWSPGAAGRGPVDAAWTDALVAGYGPVDAGCWTRARRLAALLQLKLAARRIPIHEPAWEARMAAEIAAAEQLHVAEVES